MFRRFSTRKRAVVTSFISAILLFAFISPISKIVVELVNAPSQVKNISVIEKTREVDIKWDLNSEHDINKYIIFVDNSNRIEIPKEQNTYLVTELENEREYTLSVSVEDTSGKVSAPVSFTVKPSDEVSSNEFNLYDYAKDNVDFLLINTVITVLLITILNLWVLFFKVSIKSIFTVALYPGVVLVPYLILTLSLLLTIGSFINKLLFASAISVGFLVLSYFLILTANILNGSLKAALPLEQAAKAAQFIFSLISTYLMMIYVFGSNFTIFQRIILLCPFIFYFTYSGVYMLKTLKIEQVIQKSLGVTLIMMLSIVVLSVWPTTDSIYTILSAAVIYYILLNIGLEYRSKLNISFWLEYTVLIILVIFLLFINSYWGVQGTLI